MVEDLNCSVVGFNLKDTRAMGRGLLLLLFWVQVCFVHPSYCTSVLQGRFANRSLCVLMDVFCFRLRGGQSDSQADAEPHEPQANEREGVQ